MNKLVITAAALTIVSLGSLASAQAGGGATSAASKYNQALTVSSNEARNHQSAQTADFRITEFSSSSAKSSVPKR